MTISELERQYEESRELLLRGEIDEDAFKATVEGLRFEDDLGRTWKLGWYTGRWYRYERGEWIREEPEGRKTPRLDGPPAEAPAAGRIGLSRRFFARWLVAFLIALLLLTSAVLVQGLKADWWDGSQGILPDPGNTLAPTTGHQPTGPSQAPATATDPATAELDQGPTAIATPSPEAAAAHPKQTLPPPLPELHGRIYFALYDNRPERQTFDIYAVWLDTGERQRIVSQASQPALSPDGGRLAYRSWEDRRQGIAVLAMETDSVSLWVDRPGVARPAWSPDGQRLAFAAHEGPDQPWRIFQVTDAGFECLPGQGDGFQRQMPVWLADGRLAYQGCPSNHCGLYATEADGKSLEQQITQGPDTAPIASPRGDWLAFMSERGGNWDVYLVDCQASGAEPVRLTDDPGRDGLPTWSPDGEWLAFVSDRSGAWAVWITRPDGSEQRRLFTLGGPLEGVIASISTYDQPGWTWETMAWGP